MMDFDQAIKILGLSSKFTEEELKKAHRRLSRETHPDKFNDDKEMSERQALINAARDYLKDHAIKENSSRNHFNIDEYIKQKQKELDNIIKYAGPIIQDESYVSTLNAIQKIINTFRADTFLSIVLTKQDIDEQYQITMLFIKAELEKFKSSFYKLHYIDADEVTETINFDCPLKEFYDQLLIIEEKYSKVSRIRRQLEKEIEKYKNYAGYERLEILIKARKNNALYYIKQNNFQNIEQEIEKMHQQIITEVFEVYYSLKKKISELGTTVVTIDDEEIKKEYENIKQEFQRGCSFSDTEESIKKLEELIQKYQELELKKSKHKENELLINQIYQSLMTRFCEEVKQYNIVTEYTTIKNLNEFLKQVLQAFIKGCEEFKDLDYFNQFNEITFKDATQDEKIAKDLLQQLKLNKSNIYIKTTNTYYGDSSAFFWLDEENMIMYKVEYDRITHRKITQEEFETEYISIERFLELSNYVGEYRKIISTTVRYLYKTNKFVLYFSDNQFHIIPEKIFANVTTLSPNESQDTTTFERFKDKRYVCEMIEKQVKERIEEYKKKQSQTSSEYSPDKRIFGETPYNDSDGYDSKGSRRQR